MMSALSRYISILNKKTACRRGVLAAALLTGVLLAAAPSQVAAQTVEGIRYGLHAGKTRIVIDLDKPSAFRAFVLPDPARLVIDLPAAQGSAAQWKVPRTRPVNTGDILKSYRSGDLDDGTTRIVFDLKRTAVIDSAFTLPRSSMAKDRVVIDMTPASENLFRARAEDITGSKTFKSTGKDASPPVPAAKTVSALPRNAATGTAAQRRNDAVAAAVPAPVRKPAPRATPRRPDKYIVVLDPGHGGADPGAVGKGQVLEKHITLAVAQELRRQLEETGRYRVVMTRTRDTHVRLRDRLEQARRENADLFISIHADKIERTNVRGASIYTLSRNASDAETQRLAEQENNAGVVAGVDLANESQDVAGILLDLAMREKMNESSLLARFIEEAMRRKSIKLLPNSHRSAGFAVLKAPDVPSVLIETGFLSNPSEAKLLNSADFQRRISAAVVEGVDAYFRKIEALKKI